MSRASATAVAHPPSPLHISTPAHGPPPLARSSGRLAPRADGGVNADNSETSVTVGSVYQMSWFTRGQRYADANFSRPVGRPVRNYGIVGPLITAYAGHYLSVRLCNVDVPFPVTFKAGCGIVDVSDQQAQFVGPAGCATYRLLVPANLEPQEVLNGTQKTRLPCLYYSMPQSYETAPPDYTAYSAANASASGANAPMWDNVGAPAPAQHVHGGLAGLVIVMTSQPIANAGAANVEKQRDADAYDIPLMFKPHDLNRMHPALQERTRALHCASTDPVLMAQLCTGARPLSGNLTDTTTLTPW